MGIERKQIDLNKAQEVIANFNKTSSPITTARQFVMAHIGELQQSGRPIEEIHRHLVNSGLDVGTLKYFRKLWSQAKKEQKSCQITHELTEPEKIASMLQVNSIVANSPEKSLEAPSEKEKTPMRNSGLRPITLPDGTPVEVTETGAKKFKI